MLGEFDKAKSPHQKARESILGGMYNRAPDCWLKIDGQSAKRLPFGVLICTAKTANNQLATYYVHDQALMNQYDQLTSKEDRTAFNTRHCSSKAISDPIALESGQRAGDPMEFNRNHKSNGLDQNQRVQMRGGPGEEIFRIVDHSTYRKKVNNMTFEMNQELDIICQ
jgi:hypothetical protein